MPQNKYFVFSILIIFAAIACAAFAESLAAISVLQILTFAVAWLFHARGSAAPAPTPFNITKQWRVAWIAIIAIFAFFVALQTWSVGLISDDFAIVERMRSASSGWEWTSTGGPRIANFFRPAVWIQWWICNEWSTDITKALRGVSIAWFVLEAVLLAPALRQLGFRRDVAILATILRIANPTPLLTIGWLSNIYNQCSMTFALAAIVMMKPRLQSRARTFAIFTFAVLSFLSKEDTMLLPLLVAGCLMLARSCNWRRAIHAALPFAAALVFSLIIRFIYIGQLGGYVVTGADPFGAGAMLAGLWRGVTSGFPVNYWLPIRPSVASAWPAWVIPATLCLPFLLIILALRLREFRRSSAASILLILLPLAPTFGLLTLSRDLNNIRQNYFPSAGFMTLWAMGLLAIPIPRKYLQFVIAACVAGFLFISTRDFVACLQASAAHEQAISATADAIRSAPPRSKVLLGPSPISLDGYYGFNNILGDTALLRSGRNDVKVCRRSHGVFEDYLQYNSRDHHFTRALLNPAPRTLKPGATIDLVAETGGDATCVNGNLWRTGGPQLYFHANDNDPIIYFPPICFEKGGVVKITPDIIIINGIRDVAPRISGTCRVRDGQVLRASPDDGVFLVPDGVVAAQVDVELLPGQAICIRSLTLSFQKN